MKVWGLPSPEKVTGKKDTPVSLFALSTLCIVFLLSFSQNPIFNSKLDAPKKPTLLTHALKIKSGSNGLFLFKSCASIFVLLLKKHTIKSYLFLSACSLVFGLLWNVVFSPLLPCQLYIFHCSKMVICELLFLHLIGKLLQLML